jgi:tetratricopeptide (TPR) repeat protein
MGRLDEAIANYKETLEMKSDFGSEWRIAYIYALREDYEETMKWLDQFISRAPSSGLKAEGMIWKAIYDFLLGKKENAFNHLKRAVVLAEEAGNPFRKASTDYTRGWMHYELGDFDLGHQYLQKAFDFLLSVNPKSMGILSGSAFVLGLIEVKQGRLVPAKSKLAEIKSLLPKMSPALKKDRTILHDVLHAEILMAEGFLEKAVHVYEKILPPDIPSMRIDQMAPYNMPFILDQLASGYQKMGQLDKAIAEYERLSTFDPESKNRRLIHPKYHYKLAKLYEQKGWKGKAIDQYEKFLEIWEGADPGLSEVEDGKKSLAKLKKS